MNAICRATTISLTTTTSPPKVKDSSWMHYEMGGFPLIEVVKLTLRVNLWVFTKWNN